MKAHMQARYGESIAEKLNTINITINETLDVLFSHRSVRAFTPDLITDDVFDTLIAAAQSASTSSNLQAWSVIRVENQECKQALSLLAGDQASIRECPLFLVWLADLSRFQRLAERQQKSVEAIDYLETFLVAAIDAALAAQNFVIAAESIGLGAVYIGGIRNQPDNVSQLLHLPPLVFPVFGLALGRPDPTRPAIVKPRLSPKCIVFREHYASNDDTQSSEKSCIEDSYDVLMKDFHASQGLPDVTWSRQVLSRLRGAASLQGRDRLAFMLQARGFKLK